MNILVTGATGNIGGKLVPRLVSLGHKVTCLARNPQLLSRYHWQDVAIIQGNVLDLGSLLQAMQGIETAYYLVHSMSDGVKGYEERDYLAAQNFGTAAREAGVQRIIYLGGLGVCEDNLTSHLASRQRVGDLLRLSGVPVTEFRSAVIIGPGSMSFEMIRYLIERSPIILLPRWANTCSQPIQTENVLDYLTLCLSEPASIGRLYEIGGPDVLTYREMLQEYARIRKLRRLMLHTPWLKMEHAAYILSRLTPIPLSYAHPLLGSLRSEVVVRDPSAQEDFAVELIPYTQSLHRSLHRNGAGLVESYWAGSPAYLGPGRTHRIIEGMFIEQRRLVTNASSEAVFAIITGIGGKQGWYYGEWLWRLRGFLDRLVGGVGMHRGRSESRDGLKPGDVLDGYRVEAVEPGRLLRLKNEMKAPGPAWMQFEVQKSAGGKTTYIQTAFFEPHGLSGLLYWYALYPFHQLIFNGLAHAIIRHAESL